MITSEVFLCLAFKTYKTYFKCFGWKRSRDRRQSNNSVIGRLINF